MKRLRVILLFVALVVCTHLHMRAQSPKLVVFVNIDELQTEHLLKFRNKFSQHGFNQLIRQGTFYHNADFQSASSYRGTKLLNLFTGAYPGIHGIINEKWYDINQSAVKNAYAFEAPDIESHPDSGLIVTAKIQTSTLADELLMITRGKSKIATIGLDAESNAFYANSQNVSKFWFDKTSGDIITSLNDSVKPWVDKFNSMKFADMYIKRQWGPAFDLRKYHEYMTGEQGKRHFLYDLHEESESTTPYQKILGTPFENYLVRDFAAALLLNEGFGKDDFTDMLSVHFTCKPFLNSKVELFDAEIEDMLLRLDEQIETFIQVVKENVGLEHTLFVFSSTPTMNWGVETLKQYNISTGYFNGTKTAALLNLYLMAIYGQGKWVKGYQNKQYYLNHKLIKENGVSFEEIQDKAARFLLEVSGVQNTITGLNLRTSNYTEGMYSLMQKSYYFGRSGDLFITLKPGWIEETEEQHVSTLNSEKCTIPLIFYGWKARAMQVIDKVKIVDVAPTISALLEIPRPNGAVGNPLKEILK
ncbi:alkaline phosphatase family protein [Plebeiibacterium marinum]|uniref:Alkaline phosphatase family protein n=1 Tax=Plebeiibacterium marinum TaxID=2992111 RepID=A0AAE3MGS4_9BACT|nr:alkaline phosphatase family protein [Plebeiobacterium marinum]MCW3807372.1 alkaline phosphatase family protein [Plebeiobacterium marinum]